MTEARPAPHPASLPPSAAPGVPGEALLHPAMVLAVAVLVVNDHWLKARWGADPALGVVTGKLSDVAGLAFFPLLLVSLAEVARGVRACRGGGWAFTRRELTGATVATGLGFAAVQLVPPAAAGYEGVLAVVRWVPGGLVAALAAASSPPVPEIDHVMDATDCLCLPALGLGHAVGRRVRRDGGRGPGRGSEG